MKVLNIFFIALFSSAIVSIVMGLILFLMFSATMSTFSLQFKENIETVRKDLEKKIKDVEDKTETNSSQNSNSTEANYINTEYGFSLNFPETWNEYKVKVNTNTGSDTLCFYFENQGQPFCILQIHAYPISSAPTISLESGSILGENDNYILTKDFDEEGLCVQFNEFQCERSGEVPTILETFQLL